MHYKSTLFLENTQSLLLGLAIAPNSMEFFGDRASKEVFYIQAGRLHAFNELPPKVFLQLLNAYNQDKKARYLLSNLTHSDGTPLNLSVTRKIELYTYYCYGGLDNMPDVVDGVLQQPENYRHEQDCISRAFDSKTFTLAGRPLKNREIDMIDLFAQDYKDEVVAQELGITRSTLGAHKKSLFKKGNVMTKTGLMLAAVQENLLTQNRAV